MPRIFLSFLASKRRCKWKLIPSQEWKKVIKKLNLICTLIEEVNNYFIDSCILILHFSSRILHGSNYFWQEIYWTVTPLKISFLQQKKIKQFRKNTIGYTIVNINRPYIYRNHSELTYLNYAGFFNSEASFTQTISNVMAFQM